MILLLMHTKTNLIDGMAKIEECVNINMKPVKVSEVHVKVNFRNSVPKILKIVLRTLILFEGVGGTCYEQIKRASEIRRRRTE